MSGVLVRMAQRALGVLPTAEPLQPPRFAWDAFSTGETSLGPDPRFSFESSQEIEAAGPRPVPTPKGQTARNRLFPEPERREADATAPLQPRAATLPRNDVLVPEPPARPTRLRAVAPEIAAKPADVLEEAGKSAAANDAAPPPARTAAEDRLPSDRPEPRGFADAREPAPAGTHAAFAVRAAPTEDLASEPADLASEPARRMARRDEPAARPPRKGSRELAAPPMPVEPQPEIHISIGAIELRAPRQAPVSAAQPFRPRVTLEDFLRRKPGASG